LQCWGIVDIDKIPQNILPQNGVSFEHFNGREIIDELLDNKIITGRI